MREQHLEYIGKLIGAIVSGGDVELLDGQEDSYLLTVYQGDEVYYLEIKKENRFGKSLDS